MSPTVTRSSSDRTGFKKLPVPIEELQKFAVGHAGLYETEATDADGSNEVARDIPLGMRTGGNTVINSETGIKAFVKDELAKQENHLPNSETGVWIHYLTQGIARDFGRTWEDTPKSIAIREPASKKSREQGKRVMTKKEKNELLAKLDMKYYIDDINDGKITEEEAMESILESLKYKKQLEESGYHLSVNKGDGVELFDWKSIVNKNLQKDDAWTIYTGAKFKVIIPNLIENFYSLEVKPDRLSRELVKSRSLISTLETKTMQRLGGPIESSVDGHDGHIANQNDLYKLLSITNPDAMKEISKDYNIIAYHLVQQRWSGMMKPRHVAIDCIKKRAPKDCHVFILGKGKGELYHLQYQDKFTKLHQRAMRASKLGNDV